MIDQRFMDDLAADDIIQPPQESQDTLLAAGPVTSDMPQTGVRVGRAGITPEQSAKAGGLDRPLIALLDTLAGALQGATAQTIGLPGDIRSILDMINKEGAQKYLGDPVMPTTERMQEILPAVIPQGVANQADREKTAKTFSDIGTFLPAPGIPEAAVKGSKLLMKGIKATKDLPIGLSIKPVGEGVDELGFYSAAKQAVDAIQQPKGTGDQFLKQIEKTPGVKPDEIKWTGLDDFLKSKKTVTKAEVQEYLSKNRVDVKEIQLGGIKINDKSEYALPEVMKLIKDNEGSSFDGIRLALVNDYKAYNALTKKFPNLEDTDNWGDRVLEDIIGSKEGGTKFSKWQLPGGENYREIFMTLPPKPISEDEARVILGAAPDAKLSEADIFYASRKKQDDYIVPRAHSAGINEADINRIAHMRVNDRLIDGKKTLFVEEVQSDWHQTGRKQGYNQNALQTYFDTLHSLSKKYGIDSTDKSGAQMESNLLPFLTKEETKQLDEIDKARSKDLSSVPDAPFKTTWSELSMKRVIQMASEGGYDRIAFTTGKTQAERFDLSKQINDITIARNKTNFVISATDKNGKVAMFESIPDLRNLDEIIGKDLAEKFKDDFANKSGNEHSYSGLDLQVGGEGMKGFYDDILPKFLNKYAKKWDAKTGVTEMRIATDAQDAQDSALLRDLGMPEGGKASVQVNYIDVTPKMRESVITKGQPMFAIGAGGAGAAATQTEDNK